MFSVLNIEQSSPRYSFNDTQLFQRDKQDFKRSFKCPEESARYGSALEYMVFNRCDRHGEYSTVVEFGSGTALPVISALINSGFLGVIHGYEINATAASEAQQNIARFGLSRQYVVHNESFFSFPYAPETDLLIANPPYLPCEKREQLFLPDLWGGEDGNTISKRLLSCGYKDVFLEIASYSDPAALLHHALMNGYHLLDFQITWLPFGVYSHQPIVYERLCALKEEGRAFFSNRGYLVGSALFTKKDVEDLSQEFLASLTAIEAPSSFQ